MESTTDTGGGRPDRGRDIVWRAVWAGYAAALLGTLALGGWGVLVAGKGMWWAATIGVACLFLAAAGTGFAARSAEPLNGAYIALFYFATVAVGVLVGDFLAIRPDPLPGLPRGDSTFFFVWPIAQLAAATLGAVTGGICREKLARGRHEAPVRDLR